MRRFQLRQKEGRFQIDGLVQEIGKDILLSIWGGTRPHIGAIGIAVPRPSLMKGGKWSATSSNFTFGGHKEDLLAKRISERIASTTRRNVVVTVGIHWDHLSLPAIQKIEELTQNLSAEVIRRLAKKRV